MGKRGFRSLILAGMVCAAFCGCRTGPAAGMSFGKSGGESAKAATGPATASDGLDSWHAYVAETTPSQKSYLQFDTDRGQSTPRAYARNLDARGREEGSLIGRAEFPLDQYLDPHSRGGDRPKVAWPTSPGKRLDAFFIEFRPAILEWPVEAREGETVEALAQITAFEHDGVPFAYGTCRRTMHVKGVESIRVGEQEFKDAVRMEADSDLTFGWMATIRVDETAWFARDVGLVRREERFNGRALWLFRFGGAGLYELADEVRARVEMVAEDAGGSAKGENGLKRAKGNESNGTRDALGANQGMWSRMAICLERSGRRIRVSGLAVEWARIDAETKAQMNKGGN